MPIEYNVVENLLTSPPSYSMRAVPKLIHTFDSLAREINIHNPTIPTITAKSVLEAFRAEVIYQLSIGNTINLENFISIVASLPGRLVNATDPIPVDAVDVKAKPSITLKTEVIEAATYTRLGYPTKNPSIVQEIETNSGLLNYVTQGSPMRINGTNIGFDTSDIELGVTLKLVADDSLIDQTNIALSDPSQVVVIADLEEQEVAANLGAVEYLLSIASRYTTNGQVRTGTFAKTLRCKNILENGVNQNVFVVGSGAVSANATIDVYAGTDINALAVLQIRPTGELMLSIGALIAGLGGQGAQVQITGDGSFICTDGLSDPVTFIVSDFDTLYEDVESYGRYMQEVMFLPTIGGV